jgi:3-phenylpropionate/trans-cinnamate dioxygenase ferredoxin subunit
VSEPNYQVAASVDEIAVGEIRRCVVGGVALCIVHCEDGVFHAVQENCTHERVSLCDGYVEGYEIECPLHGSIFDLRTGEVLSLPAEEPLRCYPVRTDGGVVLVALGAPSSS